MARARARSRRSRPISGASRTLSRSASPARSGATGGGGPSSDEVRSTTSSSCLMSVDSPIPSRAASARTRALVSEVTRQMMKASAAITVIVIRQRHVAIPAFPTQLPQIPTRFSHTPSEESTKTRVGFPPTSAAVQQTLGDTCFDGQRWCWFSHSQWHCNVTPVARSSQLHDSPAPALALALALALAQ
jgi:hypothetical protein